MKAANDNRKWHGFDEAVALILKSEGPNVQLSGWLICFRGVVSPERERQAANFLWFLRFERSFRDSEVQSKRDAMRLA